MESMAKLARMSCNDDQGGRRDGGDQEAPGQSWPLLNSQALV